MTTQWRSRRTGRVGLGNNSNGHVGDGTTTNRLAPVQIGTANDWASVTPGSEWTVSIKTNGTLWGWGYNASGQLGDGTGTNYASPTQVGARTNWTTATAGASGSHTVALAGS